MSTSTERRVMVVPAPASHYIGLRCSSINRAGLRCERQAGHAERRSRTGQLHRSEADGLPAVWSERI
jgi:hypothetical protein